MCEEFSSEMELLLNLVWVLISATLIGCGLAHYRRRSSRFSSRVLVLCSLVLVAILLFPAISVTDDLSPAIFAVEDSSRRTHSIVVLHSAASPVIFALVAPAAHLAPILNCIGRQLLLSPKAPTLSVIESSVAGRAPPASL